MGKEGAPAGLGGLWGWDGRVAVWGRRRRRDVGRRTAVCAGGGRRAVRVCARAWFAVVELACTVSPCLGNRYQAGQVRSAAKPSPRHRHSVTHRSIHGSLMATRSWTKLDSIVRLLSCHSIETTYLCRPDPCVRPTMRMCCSREPF